MKINFLLTQDLDSPSGLGRYYPLARELAALGHQVVIYALHSNYKDLQQKSFEQGNLQVHYVAQMHVLKQGSQKIYFGVFGLMMVVTKATLALTLAALRERPDILWAGKPHPMNGIAWLIGRFRWGCKLLLDCDDDEAGSGNFSAGWQRRLVGWFERQLPKAADLVTTNTWHTYRAIACSVSRTEQLYYLPNGIDLSRFGGKIDRIETDDLRRKLNLEAKKIVGYIGSLSLANHAVDLLFEAFAQVRMEILDAVLLIVGGGEDLETLRGVARRLKIEGAVVFVGRIPPDQIRLYYHMMNVTVDPVYDNNAARGRSPLKLFEAWGCASPVVTSAVGDRAYLAGTPPAALLVAPGDPNALAAGIIQVLSDEQTKAELIAQGVERVKSYGWDHLTRLLVKQSIFQSKESDG